MADTTVNGPYLDNAAGYPEGYGSLVQPTKYSAIMGAKFAEKSIINTITTNKWGADVKKGASVTIRFPPNVTVGEHVKGSGIKHDFFAMDTIVLPIDRTAAWGLAMDTVDLHQTDIAPIPMWVEQAAIAVQAKIDGEFLTYAVTATGNYGTTAGLNGDLSLGTTGSGALQWTDALAIDYIVRCNTILDERNVPDEGRFMVLPPWAVGLLKTSELMTASLTGDSKSTLRGQPVGVIDRMNIQWSNRVPYYYSSNNYWPVYFGWKSAAAFAVQFEEERQFMQSELLRGSTVDGLTVYGFEVINPEACGCLMIKK